MTQLEVARTVQRGLRETPEETSQSNVSLGATFAISDMTTTGSDLQMVQRIRLAAGVLGILSRRQVGCLGLCGDEETAIVSPYKLGNGLKRINKNHGPRRASKVGVRKEQKA